MKNIDDLGYLWKVKLSIITNKIILDNKEVVYKIPHRYLYSTFFFIINNSNRGVLAKSCLSYDYSFEFVSISEYEKVIEHFKFCMFEVLNEKK